MDRCGDCEREVPNEVCQVPRLECPYCGSKRRIFSRTFHANAIGSASMSSSMTRPGPYGDATLDDDGRIRFNLTGDPPRNEDDALVIAQRLVARLNSKGAQWGEVSEGEADVDAVSLDPESSGNTLNMQVVRANSDQGLWKSLAQQGHASKETDVSGLAQELIKVVRKKAARYPVEQRQQLHLIIDAGRTPSHTFQHVHDAFFKNYGSECNEFSFAGVWVVGSSEVHVARLDR
jgi:hypothetical protein